MLFTIFLSAQAWPSPVEKNSAAFIRRREDSPTANMKDIARCNGGHGLRAEQKKLGWSGAQLSRKRTIRGEYMIYLHIDLLKINDRIIK